MPILEVLRARSRRILLLTITSVGGAIAVVGAATGSRSVLALGIGIGLVVVLVQLKYCLEVGSAVAEMRQGALAQLAGDLRAARREWTDQIAQVEQTADGIRLLRSDTDSMRIVQHTQANAFEAVRRSLDTLGDSVDRLRRSTDEVGARVVALESRNPTRRFRGVPLVDPSRPEISLAGATATLADRERATRASDDSGSGVRHEAS